MDRWFCLEWRITRDPNGVGGTGGGSHLYVDGNEVTELAYTTGLATTLATPLGRLTFGQGYFLGPNNFYDMWVDEVAGDPGPIGCAR
jgi:hypothetical protein